MTAAGTRKTWPDETPEEVIERVRRQHGDVAAEIVAKEIGKDVPASGGRRRLFAGDKRSREYGGIAVRGKASRWRM